MKNMELNRIWCSIAICCLFVVSLTSWLWYIYPNIHLNSIVSRNIILKKFYPVQKFSNDVIGYDHFRQQCFKNSDPKSIEDLYKYVNLMKDRKLLCSRNHDLFHTIYKVNLRYATISVSDTFLTKLKRWLQNNEDLIQAAKNQSLIFITNLYSYESVVFNTVRASRPVASVKEGDAMNYVNKLVMKTAHDCHLCSYKNNTAHDFSSRIESSYAVITSSTFKVDTYHSLLFFKHHNPLKFSQLEFMDAMNLAMQWYRNIHKSTPALLYRSLYWDILPKAGSEDIHPHLHLVIGDNAYNTKWNQMFQAGLKFSIENNGLNYWTSLLQIHTFLGLSLKFGDASLMAYLNPQKDAEIMIIAPKPCLDFFRLVYFTLRGFIDDMGLYALSMGFVFPKINSSPNSSNELPMIFRIVSRGSADSARSDIGSFGFFGTVNVNRDPFKLIKQIKKSVFAKQKENFTFSSWKDDGYY